MLKEIFSSKCSSCATVIPLGELFCDECSLDIVKHAEYCSVCGYPIVKVGANCKRCDRGMMKKVDKIYSTYRYTGSIRKLLINMKFKYNFGAINKLDRLIELPKFERRYDAIVPVPSHFLRRFRRLAHPSDLIAKYVACELGVDLVACMKRYKYTDFQYKRKSTERIENVSGVFRYDCDRELDSVLLVDDILTTGATINECAKVLKANGVKFIDCFSFTADR